MLSFGSQFHKFKQFVKKHRDFYSSAKVDDGDAASYEIYIQKYSQQQEAILHTI